MAIMDPLFQQRMRDAWKHARERYEGYELISPGDPSFICQAEACVAHCCKVFSVALTEHEVERLSRFSGKQASEFLECEDGEPIYLPLADPYLLAREDGHCAQLGDDLLCTEYEGRPDACRLYPHHVVFVDQATGRPMSPTGPGMRRSIVGGEPGLVPLLLRHLECPGFTGPPLPESDWQALFVETYRLQYHDRQPLPV